VLEQDTAQLWHRYLVRIDAWLEVPVFAACVRHVESLVLKCKEDAETTGIGAKRKRQQCDKDEAAIGKAGRSVRGKCEGVCDVTRATQSAFRGPAALTRAPRSPYRNTLPPDRT
jgi:hypothetical protein